MLRNLVYRHPAEFKALTARLNRCRHLLRVRSRQNKYSVCRRLLQCFQQSIESSGRKHVHLVDNINLVTAFGRCKGYLLAQVTDIIYAGVGRSVNFNYIQRGSLHNALTVAALAAGLGSRPLLAIQGLGQNTRHTGLTGAAWTGKQIGVSNFTACQSIFQGCFHSLLSHKSVKILRTPLAV